MNFIPGIIRRNFLFALPLSALLLTHSAQAYLQVVYTSQFMPLTNGIDIGEIDSTSRPALRISFAVEDMDWQADTRFQLDANTFFIELGSPDNGFSPMGFSVLSPSSLDMSLDANRQISAWRFNLFLEDDIPPDLPPLDKHLRELTEARAQFDSRHGAIHCNIDGELSYDASGIPNCDVDKYYTSFKPLYYFPRSDTWIGLQAVEHFYYERNSLSQWTVTNVEVTEPRAYLLFAIALLLLIARQRLLARRRISR